MIDVLEKVEWIMESEARGGLPSVSKEVQESQQISGLEKIPSHRFWD